MTGRRIQVASEFAFVRHSSEWTHVLSDLGRTALIVALMYGVVIAVVKLATRSKRSGDRESQYVRGSNRQQRRQERAANRRKRHS